MKIHYKIIIVFCLFLLSMNISYAQLSEQEKMQLVTLVRNSYDIYGLEGAQVFKTTNHYVLVDIEKIVSKMNSMAQTRIAEQRANRKMIEFLKSAKNKSVSAYSYKSEETHNFIDNSKEDVSSVDELSGSVISHNAKENEISKESETLDDKIVQKASKQFKGVQALSTFRNNDGEMIYIYFTLLSKSSAKSKN